MTAVGIGHGKLILLGEHAVVYGRPALAAAIARGCRAEARPAAESSLAVEPWGVQVFAARPESDPDRELLRRALTEVWQGLGPSATQLAIQARMEVPGGAGLGGSAALSVAVIRAAAAALGKVLDEAQVVALSLAWERVFHGNPSGIDSAMAAHGGLALYRRGQPLAGVSAGKPLALVVADSGERASTKVMVESVARQHTREKDKSELSFDAIAALVAEGKLALERGDHPRFGQLMDLNQKLLNTFVLSTTKLEAMCRSARQAGALGAKLTGSGGGGCMIALARDPEQAGLIAAALSAEGTPAFVVEVQ